MKKYLLLLTAFACVVFCRIKKGNNTGLSIARSLPAEHSPHENFGHKDLALEWWFQGDH